MMPTIVVSLLLQQITVAPFPCEAGADVVVQASSPAGPLPDLAIAAEWMDGGRLALGRTDAEGRLRFAAGEPGVHRVAASWQGVRIVAPLRVVAAPRRWWYAAVCVPLGLALLAMHLRARGRAR